MGNDWPTVTFGSLYKEPSRNGLTKPKKVRGEGYKFINMGEIFSFDRMLNIPCDRAPLSEKEIKTSLMEANDLLFARQSLVLSGAGKCSIFLGDDEPVAFESHLIRVRLNEKLINPEYAYYYFVSPQGRELIKTIVEQGAGQAGIRGSDLERLQLPLPPICYQDYVVSFMKEIDNKITLNRQINQTLEQMAQTLFKSWFVDFDPVIDNALDAGNAIPDEQQERAEQRQALRHVANEANKANQPHSIRTNPAAGDALASPYQPLPDDIRQLFPNEFEESELGWVPKGWGCVNLTMLVDTISKTYPLKTVEEVIFLNTGDIEDGRFLHSDYSKVSGLPGQAKKSIQRNDILFSEIRPKNKRFAFVNFDSEHHVVSTKLMVLRAKEAVNPLFAYFLLTLEKTTNELQRIAELRSGTFPQITYNELGLISFALPDNSDLIEKFVVSYLQPFYDKSFKVLAENETLNNLRDTLLPKLISGELRLDEVEPSIEETITATTA